MPGVDINDIPETPCPFCRQKVSVFDGTFSEGRWYHEKCALYKTGERIDKLEKKAKRGSITLEEAEELKDLKILYENLKRPDKTTDIRKFKQSPIFFGNKKIALVSLQPKEEDAKQAIKASDKPLLTEAINSK